MKNELPLARPMIAGREAEADEDDQGSEHALIMAGRRYSSGRWVPPRA